MRGAGWRTAAMGAATAWGVLVVLITELLSLAQGLTTTGLATTWLVVDVVALIYLWQGTRRRTQQNPLQVPGLRARQMISRLPRMQMFLLLGVGAIITLVAIVAVLSPPNTWDAMAYHMPHVVNWIQHRSISFYPTPDHRQLHMPPWAEFAMLHMHLLSGTDRLANLIQWASLLGSVIGVTLLAQLMGADRRGQILAAVLCTTIPQGLLEASGAKSNYVMAFWMVILAYYLLAFKREPTWANTLGMGGSLGLAWLTKGTAYIFSLAIGFTCIVAWPWKPKLTLSRRLPFVVAFALALNAGIFVRNYTLYASPFGPTHYGDPSLTLSNESNGGITPSTFVSNALRNLALHLGTPVAAINTVLERGIVAAIRVIGEDPNNPHTTWSGMTFHVPESSIQGADPLVRFHLVSLRQPQP
jgi:hypothetical protein